MCQAGTQALCEDKEAVLKHKLKLKVPPEKYPFSQGSLSLLLEVSLFCKQNTFLSLILNYFIIHCINIINIGN